MSSCELVSCGPPGTAKADVVFLHGIQGDAQGTWTNESGGFWPSWLAAENRELAVWTVGYDAAASAWTGTAMALFDRANNILAQLQAAGIGTRPICWVAHSMGGLLVKQMLRNADSIAPEFRPISAATRGVVFIATPHTGSEVATITRYLSFLRISVATKELQALSAPLVELNSWYRENHRRLGVATQVFFEYQPTKGIHVVDRGSADPGLEGVLPIGLDADHFSICKPSGTTSLLYRRTESFIRRHLDLPMAGPPEGDDARDALDPESCAPPWPEAPGGTSPEATAAPDLAALDREQLRVLRACINALRAVADCLADLRQTSRLAIDFGDVFTRTESAVDAAGDQLSALAQQVGGRSWPHKEWAFIFADAERQFRQHSLGRYQSPASRLSGPIAAVLRILEMQYPSLFAD